ncbi:MAG: hypothetical protein JW864_11640 [Spirochaetes bacterium]|nr:hypothetical protein [Spirochaetota bacterium]
MENNTKTESQDPAPLIDSIKSESERQIKEITEKAENEMAALEMNYKNYIDTFVNESSEKLKKEIFLEVGKLKHRAEIEKKKLHLKIIEEVIQKLITEALEELKSDENRYNEFLKKKIYQVLKEIKGSRIFLRISPEGMFLHSMIQETIKDSGYKGTADIIKDENIKTGGFIVDDFENNLSFNNCFERILFRNYDIIRKNAFDLIIESEKQKY